MGVAACSGSDGTDPVGDRTQSPSAAPTEPGDEGAETSAPAVEEAAPQPLLVSDNDRYLTDADGEPFVYQGDTAWALIGRGSREDVITYLDARQKQGYNVIQTAAIFPIEGTIEPNAEGEPPIEGDVSQPNEAYFEHVEFVVDEIEQRGMHVALFPIWMSGAVENGFIDEDNAEGYGRFIGERFSDHESIIWVMGGDSRQYDYEVDRALALGVTEGVTGGQHHDEVLMTYHPGAPRTSAEAYHDEEWLDFNMLQTSHCGVDVPFVRQAYELEPPKPYLDAESIYEDHPICWEVERGYSTPEQVRAGMYTSVFTGGFGFVYGNQATWQMYAPEHEAIIGPQGYWYDMLDREAAGDAVHLRRLLESRPILTRIPDQSMLGEGGEANTSVLVTRDSEGSYALAYARGGGELTLDLSALSGSTAQLWWYDPRSGETLDAGQQPAAEPTTVTPPDDSDWVLIVDDAAAGYGPPETG